MVKGKLGYKKKKTASRAYRALRRAKIPKPVAKAGANRVGQVTKLKSQLRKRRRMKRY